MWLGGGNRSLFLESYCFPFRYRLTITQCRHDIVLKSLFHLNFFKPVSTTHIDGTKISVLPRDLRVICDKLPIIDRDLDLSINQESLVSKKVDMVGFTSAVRPTSMISLAATPGGGGWEAWRCDYWPYKNKRGKGRLVVDSKTAWTRVSTHASRIIKGSEES